MINRIGDNKGAVNETYSGKKNRGLITLTNYAPSDYLMKYRETFRDFSRKDRPSMFSIRE